MVASARVSANPNWGFLGGFLARGLGKFRGFLGGFLVTGLGPGRPGAGRGGAARRGRRIEAGGLFVGGGAGLMAEVSEQPVETGVTPAGQPGGFARQ